MNYFKEKYDSSEVKVCFFFNLAFNFLYMKSKNSNEYNTSVRH